MARDTKSSSSSSSSSSHHHGTMLTAVVAIAALVAMFMVLPDQTGVDQSGFSEISGNPVQDQAWVDAREGRVCKTANDATCGESLTCRQRVPYVRGTKGGQWDRRTFARGEGFKCASKIPLGGPCLVNNHCQINVCSRGRCSDPGAQQQALQASSEDQGSCVNDLSESEAECRARFNNCQFDPAGGFWHADKDGDGLVGCSDPDCRRQFSNADMQWCPR